MSTPVIGFEDEMGTTGRDYGQEAMLRRLGFLAKQRREELGMGRPSFAKRAGVGSDRTVYDFEIAKNVPMPLTLTRFERALGWRTGSIQEFLGLEDRKASSVKMEDLDDYDSRPSTVLSSVPLPDLLQELQNRLAEMQSNVTGKPFPAVPTHQDMVGLAASGGHKPEHLDEDPDDDISGFNASEN